MHSLDVTGDTATVLIVTAPPGLEDFLHDFHVAGVDRAKVASRYGIIFVPST